MIQLASTYPNGRHLVEVVVISSYCRDQIAKSGPGGTGSPKTFDVPLHPHQEFVSGLNGSQSATVAVS